VELGCGLKLRPRGPLTFKSTSAEFPLRSHSENGNWLCGGPESQRNESLSIGTMPVARTKVTVAGQAALALSRRVGFGFEGFPLCTEEGGMHRPGGKLEARESYAKRWEKGCRE